MQIEITQGNNSCTTKKIDDFRAGEDLELISTNKKLGDCSNFTINLNKTKLPIHPIYLKIETQSENEFLSCTVKLSFEFKNTDVMCNSLSQESKKLVKWEYETPKDVKVKPLDTWSCTFKNSTFLVLSSQIFEKEDFLLQNIAENQENTSIPVIVPRNQETSALPQNITKNLENKPLPVLRQRNEGNSGSPQGS